jgi:hypothetical protein
MTSRLRGTHHGDGRVLVGLELFKRVENESEAHLAIPLEEMVEPPGT